MKKIALNALILNPRSGGLGIYLQQLIQHFLQDAAGLDLRIFVNKKDAAGMLPSQDEQGRLVNLPIPSQNAPIRIFKETMIWPGILRREHFDLFHSPMSYFPFVIPVPALLTVHDLRSFHMRESYGIARRRFLNQRIRASVRRARHIIAISGFTRDDLLELFDISADRVSVIHEGIDESRFRRRIGEEQWQVIRSRYQLPARYILSVGHLEPRKNYINLLKAYALLRAGQAGVPPLVIVGQENWHFQPIYNLVASLGLTGRVFFTHFVAAGDLPAIYQRSLFFITASLYEGFGFTPLEAMAADVPVAYAAATSLPEIAGPAGLGFNPLDPEEMARVMQVLVDDEELRKALVLKGRENLKRFSWSHCCRSTLDLYHRIIA
ncbi:MAG TPA: glycosyltransferase family 1 protein [bacterium]|nr:glycosyltransferase family 1 protein [bacterium]HQI50130.1 glycosyltransferase family 1 protein [bacterium]HQJ64206.1 glycosyltransferase family 1 protein [bacterium]